MSAANAGSEEKAAKAAMAGNFREEHAASIGFGRLARIRGAVKEGL